MRALSRTVCSFERSPIRVMLDSAARFPDAIHLEIGQPDFPTPTHIVEAAVQAARYEYTGYTANAGMIELRRAVTAKLARENELVLQPENVMVTMGAMEAVYASMAVTLDPGDEILVPDPGYGNFVMAATLLNAISRPYPTLADQGFIPDFAALEALLSPRTKAMLINSPSNPTGAVYPEWVLRECLDFCQRHDLYLISDETYDRLVFEGQHVSPGEMGRRGPGHQHFHDVQDLLHDRLASGVCRGRCPDHGHHGQDSGTDRLLRQHRSPARGHRRSPWPTGLRARDACPLSSSS